MSDDWTCPVCNTPVRWGEPLCPLCGSAIEWQEEDENDPVGYLLPSWAEDDGPGEPRARGARLYAALALAAGLVMLAIGAASGHLLWGWLVPGLLFAGAGLYGLMVRRLRF